jgi:alpha-glucosidase (family GH31 glycosyl hydrolase)
MGGLKENIGMIANPRRSTYEIPFLTHDAGGYDYFGSTEQSDELYMRWMQFASMNSVMTIFSTAKNPTRNHPYRYPVHVRDNFKKYTHLRMMLFPYIYSYAMKTYLTGIKMVQGDGIHSYQYLLGNEILVAPVYEKGKTRQEVFLPQGEWYDLETDQLYQGDQTIIVPAPVEKLPMFVRKGSIIPMRNYARAIELGNNDTLIVHVYPTEEKTSFALYEDDGLSNDYLQGVYSTLNMSAMLKSNLLDFTIDPIIGNFSGMSPDRRYEIVFHDVKKPLLLHFNGVKVLVNGSETSFDYFPLTRILKVFINTRKSEQSLIRVKF